MYSLFEYHGFEDIEGAEIYIRDILQELEDDGFEIIIDRYSFRDDLYFEVYIKKPGGIFTWREVKDPVISLVEWYYSNGHYTSSDNISPIRFFNGGVEFGIGWSNEKDFSNLLDTISFTNLKLIIKIASVKVG